MDEPTNENDQLADMAQELRNIGAQDDMMQSFADLVRQKYMTYVAAGFTPDQSLWMTCWEFYGMKAVQP